MCDTEGCDQPATITHKTYGDFCRDCMTIYTDEGAPEESFVSIADDELIVNLDENPGPVADQTIEIDPAAVSIIPTKETDLSIFVEDLTTEQLEVIKAEIELLPTVIDKKTYDITFSMHQVVKKIRQLTKKSVVTKIKIWKTEFESKKSKLNMDHAKLLATLEPMEKELSDAREWWDMLIDAYKMNIAVDQEKEEAAELARQQLIKDEFEAHDMNALEDQKRAQDKKDAELKAQTNKLEREKYEFACEKERAGYTAEQAEIVCYRMTKTDALEGAYEMNHDWDEFQEKTKDALSQDQLDDELKKIDPDFNSETEEKALDEFMQEQSEEFKELSQDDHAAPAETVEILTTDDIAALPSNIDEKLNKIDSDLEKATSETGPTQGMIESITICQNPEQDYIDSGRDDQTFSCVCSEVDGLISIAKGYKFTDPSKQQKLENFILNVEINFNTFKKGTEDGN